jgi:gliding motility-associated-like protein
MKHALIFLFALLTSHVTIGQFADPVENPFGISNFVNKAICGSFADVDQDGDLDLIVSDSLQDNTFLFENKGTPTSPSFGTSKLLLPFRIHYIDIKNIDGVNGPDITGGSPGNGIFVRLQSPGPFPYGGTTLKASDFNQKISLPINANFIKPSFADIDSDGDLDCFLSVYDNQNNTFGTYYYQSNLSSRTPSNFLFTFVGINFSGLGLSNYPPQQAVIDLTDFNLDGKYDIFYGLEDGTLLYYENYSANGPLLFNPKPVVNFKSSYNGKSLKRIFIEFADIDGDGDEDLFVFNRLHGDVVFYRSKIRDLVVPTDVHCQLSGVLEVSLSWTDNSSFEDGFIIERSTDNQTFNEIGRVVSNATLYIDKSVSAGQTYYYRVIAYMGSRKTDPSAACSTQTEALLIAPSGLKVESATSTSVSLSWSDNNDHETGLVLERSKDNVTWEEIVNLPAQTTSYTDVTVEASTTYYYRIRSFKDLSYSPYSNIVSTTTPRSLLPGTLLATARGWSSIIIEWPVEDAGREYLIERSLNEQQGFASIAKAETNTSSFVDNGLQELTTYYYRLAIDNNGNKSYSPVASATTDKRTPLDIPTLFTPDGDSFNETWNILNLDKYNDYNIEVFDRAGKTVFAANEYGGEKEWNGTYHGRPLPDGTYTYSIKLNKGSLHERGVVTILRKQ